MPTASTITEHLQLAISARRRGLVKDRLRGGGPASRTSRILDKPFCVAEWLDTVVSVLLASGFPLAFCSPGHSARRPDRFTGELLHTLARGFERCVAGRLATMTSSAADSDERDIRSLHLMVSGFAASDARARIAAVQTTQIASIIPISL